MHDHVEKPTVSEVKALAASVSGLFVMTADDAESRAWGWLTLGYSQGMPPQNPAERRRLFIRQLARNGCEWCDDDAKRSYEEDERQRIAAQEAFISSSTRKPPRRLL